jgi:ABC-2 type transport system ATP-binding protein
MPELAVETFGLRKWFGDKLAVDDLTLTVRRGEVFGFLGPNGAGKTTSVKMLLGLTHPSEGDARVLGAPIGDRPTRARLGFLPEHFRFQEWLTGREFLEVHGRLYGLRGAALAARIDELLDRVDLDDAAHRKLHGYSKGMLQRIGLAQALLNAPELVFLDEPTSGLDPIGRLLVRDCIADLRDAGTAVFLNSHLLSEVEVTCDRVAFVKRGRVVRELALADAEIGVEVELRVATATPELLSGLERFGRVVGANGGTIRIVAEAESRIPEIASFVVASGAGLYRLASGRRSLEALFLEVIGEDERAG